MNAYFENVFSFYTVASSVHNVDDTPYPSHWHLEIEIIRICKGKITVTIEGNSIDGSEGDIFVCPSNFIHATYSYADSISDVVRFSSELPKKFGLSISYPLFHIPFELQKKFEIDHVLDNSFQMLKKNNVSGEFNHILVQLEILKIWTLLLKYFNQKSSFNKLPNSENQKSFFLILQYINKHYNENITLSDIATIANYTPSYTSRLFKELIGTNFKKYLASVRIKKVCAALLETEDPIGNIASYCGFDSYRTFNETFQKIMNCTPHEFRQKQRYSNHST